MGTCTCKAAKAKENPPESVLLRAMADSFFWIRPGVCRQRHSIFPAITGVPVPELEGRQKSPPSFSSALPQFVPEIGKKESAERTEALLRNCQTEKRKAGSTYYSLLDPIQVTSAINKMMSPKTPFV